MPVEAAARSIDPFTLHAEAVAAEDRAKSVACPDSLSPAMSDEEMELWWTALEASGDDD